MKKKAGKPIQNSFRGTYRTDSSVFMCLFFFYVLIINATRSHGDLQKGFLSTSRKIFP